MQRTAATRFRISIGSHVRRDSGISTAAVRCRSKTILQIPPTLNGRVVMSANKRPRIPYFPTYPLRHNRQLCATNCESAQTSATSCEWIFVRISYGVTRFLLIQQVLSQLFVPASCHIPLLPFPSYRHTATAKLQLPPRI